mgnify:FL=1
MTKININRDKVKFENLYKSFFNDITNTAFIISDNSVAISQNIKSNLDPASVELKFEKDEYVIYFWDGYSLAEKFTEKNYESALKTFKKFAKKLAKNLRRF